MDKRIYPLIEDAEKITYLDAELYLVDASSMKTFMQLKNTEEGRIRCVGEKAADFNYTEPAEIKLLNPNNPCYKYTLAALFTPRTIADPAKVYERLDKEFELWKNVRKKALREELKNEDYAQERADKLRSELEIEITTQEDKLRDLQENFEDYDIFVTNFESAKKYPAIYMNFKDEQRNTANLSIRAKNILWYDQDMNKAKKRSDANIEERIAQASKLGSTIYYKKKLS